MAGDLLERIDRIAALVAELRAEVAGIDLKSEANGLDADDLAPEHLLDTTSAQERFGYPRNTLAKWAREGLGVRRGGRWLLDPEKLRRRLNGK
jgi:hypothetical protein